MTTTIDATGRLVIPKSLRQQLGFSAGAELELTVVDGHLEVTMPSRVRADNGPRGIRFLAETDAHLDAEQVRDLMERGRR